MTESVPYASLVFALGASIFLLLALIIGLRLPAFFALVFSSIVCGLLLGLEPTAVVSAVQNGMGGLLGYIAVIIGLGSIFGALLEHAGGVGALAERMTARGSARSLPWKTALLGVIVAIPVFFDVAFIILVSLVHRLSAAANRHVFFVAGPLLAGLAAAHAFIPPTPGPVAVAAILKADLGWVILFGVMAALPAVAVAGPLFSYFFFDQPPTTLDTERPHRAPTDQIGATRSMSFAAALAFLLLPLIAIAGGTILGEADILSERAHSVVRFLTHPFIVLLGIVALFYVYAAIALKTPFAPLNKVAGSALEPAGAVILVTGAGGAFKQVLVDSGAGVQIAELVTAASLPPLAFAFLTAAIVRVIQGSATVAMITAAGLTAPIIDAAGPGDAQRALIVIAVASGATLLSHVNDSGFWLISRYLDLSELETLKSWTALSTLLGLTGFIAACAISIAL